MTRHIQKGDVAGKVHIFFNTADPDGLAALTMQVAPIPGERCLVDNDGIGRGRDAAVGRMQENANSAWRIY